MDSRRFNSLMPRLNEQWSAKVLHMQRNEGNGPDLHDNEKIVEVKFCLYPNPKNYKKWNLIKHQENYPKREGKIGFIGLGIYSLEIPVSQIRTKELTRLESLVNQREIQIVPYEWMKQFERHETKGETHLSKWAWTFRYMKGNKLPKIAKTISVEGGLVHLSEGIDPKYFEKIGTPYVEEFNDDCPF